MVDDIKKKKTEKLADQGFQFLSEERYEEAIKISKQLEELRYTAAFDIGAQAYCGLGDMDKAILTLKRGIKIQPKCWPNLQLLGNYLSDIGEYEEAESKYEQALKCEDVWEDSIHLNQAILANRREKYDKALYVLELINDVEFRLHKAEITVTAYKGKGLINEAIELAENTIAIWNGDETGGDIVGRIAASLGRMWISQGKPQSEVREWAFNSLKYDETNEMLLSLIRDIDDKYSDSAKYFRLFVHCMIPFTHPSYGDVIGYFVTYHVVADTKDEALLFAREFEDEDFRMNLTIEESEILELRPDSPKGVYWYSERAFYESDE